VSQISHRLRRCQMTTNIILKAFVDKLNEKSRGGKISIAEVERLAHSIMEAGSPLSEVHAKAHADCLAYQDTIRTLAGRTNVLGRLVIGTFSHLFKDPDSTITRAMIPRFLRALYMLLGEERLREHTLACATIIEDLRANHGEQKAWELFRSDPRSKAVLEKILVRIANRFMQFNKRKSWFNGVMSTDLQSETIDGSAFIIHKRDHDDPTLFRDRQFYLLFSALFSSVHIPDIEKSRGEAFLEVHGVSARKVFGPFTVELVKLSAHGR